MSYEVDTSIKYSLLLCEHFPCVGKYSQTLEFETQHTYSHVQEFVWIISYITIIYT